MWLQSFWMQNIHFALEVLVGLTCFATAWLYVDSWVIRKEAKVFLRTAGFFSLTVWAVINATSLDVGLLHRLELIAGFAGFLLVLISFAIDPLPQLPGAGTVSQKKEKGESSRSAKNAKGYFGIPTLAIPGIATLAAGANTIALFIITILVYRRYTKGLIREWRALFYAFALLTLSGAVTIAYAWNDSSNVILTRLVETYGVVWYVEHGLKFLAFLLLARWTWGYLRFRLIPQLFITYVAIVFLVFGVTTIGFSTILLRDVQRGQLEQLRINVQTVEYAIEGLKNEAELVVKIAAGDATVRDALALSDTERLYTVTNRIMIENETDFFVTANSGADVVMRGEDKTNIGDNLATDPVIVKAFAGITTSSIVNKEGILAPTVLIQAASPVYSDAGKIIGVVMSGYVIDNAFVDGLKKVTDLDAIIYGDAFRSATTLLTPGTTSREIGLEETNAAVLQKVMRDKEIFTGAIEMVGTPFYVAYTPLLDSGNNVIGMMAIGRPQQEIIDATNVTVRFTFIVSVLLMGVAIVPSYFLAKYISRYQNV